ncbi:type II CAAX prenyl endopeptidase Rce1 family protein [Trichocoleus sp. FACHB-262]|uniref:CPBP family glutamic-type intramembrane protease n=1 Tax=Trichocoleus sp. FACHB-262 TaxID=2692869 RepID=UPI00168533C9|nr:CPBP family glutamic-type intramembrane protease [Trichocoleus sp. FACHB-262]MBD2122157.1 CPBP family intramembrane metalloprotease [Trichocoleus sp. FACHB-262]
MALRSIKQKLYQSGKYRLGVFVLLAALAAIACLLLVPKPKPAIQATDYAIHSQLSFNQPQFYPPSQKPPTALYQPVGEWVGRLILPSQGLSDPKLPDDQQSLDQANNASASDWVWLEVQHAPSEAQSLVRKVVRLEWSPQLEVQAYVRAVTQNVSFTARTETSKQQGNIHPDRLNGHKDVGPLQSLAGARPNDDVIVTLKDVTVVPASDSPSILQISQEPVLATGRLYGLVKILGVDDQAAKQVAPSLCQKSPTCAHEFFRVQHYNPASKKFDGVLETVRIPQQLAGRSGIAPSTPRHIETSPAGKAGWYIYGAKSAEGVFVVQAIQPRSLVQLQSDRVVLGHPAGLTYINQQNWQKVETQKGTVRKVLVKPGSTVTKAKARPFKWKLGDRAIVLHTFGGIGGRKAEAALGYTVTGHFSYGLAEVVREPLTQELQFDVQYQQVYAHNPNAIISGTTTWPNYMGNLQWGWLGTRPVSDVLVKFDPVLRDYGFGGITLSPLREFQQQLQVMMARYRVGDGTGSATVTPATSCVQDSNQALYATILHIKQQVSSTPVIQSWLAAHPKDEQTLRFQQLVSLAKDLEQRLIPLGILRSDWQQNATVLAGTNSQPDFTSSRDPLAGLTSWRTMIPRQAQDELANLFLQHGAQLWFLRTNQVGGWNPDIVPVAPTALLGQLTVPVAKAPIASILLNRVLSALNPSDLRGWIITVGLLFLYGAIALPLGFASGFLQINLWPANWLSYCLLALRALLTPALLEELGFRVLLLPHPTVGVAWYIWGGWAVLSLLLFILYHPLNGKTLYKAGAITFLNPIFLALTGLLGVTCTVVYAVTGSLWTIAFVHWVVVVVWLIALGGHQKLSLAPSPSSKPSTSTPGKRSHL